MKLCQKLTEMNQYQGKQMVKLISQIETITKLLALDRAIASPQEEDKRDKTKANKIFNISGQFHNNPDYFWELENDEKIGQLGE